MDTSYIMYLGRHTLELIFILSAPVLITCIVVGVLVTLIQAVTSIRDMTLTVVPKLLAVGIVIIIFSGWMMDLMIKFTNELFAHIQNMGQ